MRKYCCWEEFSNPEADKPLVDDGDITGQDVDTKLLIFLSHASDDRAKVRSLCKRLRDDGFDPWLDEERLLPGQDWNLEIQKALQASDAILLCFSTSSVNKAGYIQREYKSAMKVQEEKPEGAIFVIPVRFDDCQMPSYIQGLQWVDYPANYDRLILALRSKVPRKIPLGEIPPGIAPQLPELFVGRENDILELHRRLTGATNATLQTAVVGWPGIGKTSFVATIAHDTALRPVFTDGVLWTALGQQPKIEDELGNWLVALGLDPRDFPTKETRSNRLAAVLRLKRMLLIIDDVWEAKHAQPFLVGGYECRTLIATREPRVVRALGLPEEAIYNLLGLSGEASLNLLQKLAPEAIKLDPDGARRLTDALEGSPLGLQVAGGKLAAEFKAGLKVIDLLKELTTITPLLKENAPANRADLLTQTTPTIAALLEISTNRLEPVTRERFALLGVFASQPATFDIRAVAAAWEVDDPKPTLRELRERGLIEYLRNVDRYQIHALLAAYAKFMWETNM